MVNKNTQSAVAETAKPTSDSVPFRTIVISNPRVKALLLSAIANRTDYWAQFENRAQDVDLLNEIAVQLITGQRPDTK
jgi:hypothetical protein